MCAWWCWIRRVWEYALWASGTGALRAENPPPSAVAPAPEEARESPTWQLPREGSDGGAAPQRGSPGPHITIGSRDPQVPRIDTALVL